MSGELGRQRIINFLRALRLLPLAERLRFMAAAAKSWRANKKAVAANPGVAFPPLWLLYDTIGNCDYRSYLETGKETAELFGRIIKKHLPPGKQRVCEWGCGLGRVLRHLPALPMDLEVCGSDYNGQSVEWCQKNLAGCRIFKNELAPPLPFENNYFDFVYSISVFTHLSEQMHYEWLNECLRVTRPGGLILLTVHGEYSRQKLLPDEREKYDRGELVVRSGVYEGSRIYVAFQNVRFMREKLLKGLEIVSDEYFAAISASQNIWMVRKPG
jgi:SAM-dependent methyltransferase